MPCVQGTHCGYEANLFLLLAKLAAESLHLFGRSQNLHCRKGAYALRRVSVDASSTARVSLVK